MHRAIVRVIALRLELVGHSSGLCSSEIVYVRNYVGDETACKSPWRQTDADESFLAGIQRSTITARMNSLHGGRKGVRRRYIRNIGRGERHAGVFRLSFYIVQFINWSHSFLLVPLNVSLMPSAD